MGKRARKTRWRTLEIADEHSDSEESNTNSAPRIPKTYQQKSYYNRFSTYSSQSTPTRRYQHDSSKSTRSSSTASENKITFNEDEYTRITTPRQDVLFKKGYLNKPKTYQTQTSTGNSTTSTGNSTGNGTPDHQSTDLEYESQFVFPNGFVDQNGFYFVNSYEPYPLMLYNPPTYYPEFSNVKSKRYSTGSLTESTSPNNEEATSQDLSHSGGEASNNVSEINGHVYNVVYPHYYVNGVCPPQEFTNGHCTTEPRRLKKRRRRKLSKTQTNKEEESTSEYTDEEASSDEVFSDDISTVPSQTNSSDHHKHLENSTTVEEAIPNGVHENKEDCITTTTPPSQEDKTEENDTINEETSLPSNEQSQQKYSLKPDAEEFVPRSYNAPHENLPVQFIKIPPNFVPVPIINPMGDYAQNFNHAFIPPGIPVNFVPADPKMFPNFVGFVPNAPFTPKTEEDVNIEEVTPIPEDKVQEIKEEKEELKVVKDVPKVQNNRIDIAKIVSKLEEAAKEQNENDCKVSESSKVEETVDSKEVRAKFKNTPYNGNRRNNFYKTQKTPYNSPAKENRNYVNSSNVPDATKIEAQKLRHTPEKQRRSWTQKQNSYGSPKRTTNSFDSAKNYSETLKKTQAQTQSRSIPPSCDVEEKKVATPKKKENLVTPTKSVPSNSKVSNLPNQWISVSSRKKRKNKNLETENEELEETLLVEEGVQETELFESYDVNLLEDVIPPHKIEESSTPLEEATVEDILSSIAQTSEVPNSTENIKIPEVSEIEKELILKVENESLQIEESNVETTVTNKSSKSKKKSKKGGQKPVTKRIMITDVDLSMTVEDNMVNKIEEIHVKEEKEPEVVIKVDEEESKKEENVVPVVTSKKKKKKKTQKPTLNGSLSSSNATININDDSYDFLLENSLLDESTDKTNIEISQQLDKMIQKGMYNNLEGKIKSLNISQTDDFFQNVMNNISNRESSIEKTGFTKTTDFSKILKNTMHMFKPSSVSLNEDISTINLDISKVTLPNLDGAATSGTPSKAGPFLENPEVNEILSKNADEITKVEAGQDQQVQQEDVTEIVQQKETNPEVNDKYEQLYPITQAVKEWMSKTRETTPEVEILKSPSTILKEFGEDSESETEVESVKQKNVNGNSLSGKNEHLKGVAGVRNEEDEEEVTVWSMSRENSVEDDLLDCWDNNDVHQQNNQQEKLTNGATKTQHKQNGCATTKSNDIEKGEDVLEIYESKYGKNEDYLNLKAEIEKSKQNKFPKHNNLPYRAICCSIM